MAGRFYVAPPPFTPYPYGLMSVASIVDEADPHWRGGTETDLNPCAPAGLSIEACTGVAGGGAPTPRAKDTGRGVTSRTSDPFTLYGAFNCGAGGREQGDMRERAGMALTNGEGRTLERVVEVGYSDLLGEAAPAAGLLVHPFLSDAPATVTSAATDPVEALGALEAELGLCYGGVGVIHANRGIVTAWIAAGLVMRDGPRLRTVLGTMVAAGGGYKGTSPSGAGSTLWAYATGAVAIRRGAVEVPSTFTQSFDRSINDVFLLAERTYTVSFDCCLLAAETDVTI